ncbi:clotting factor G beta subunit-like [Lycorma delicatula]|uniref:clotting factor G beta subunit-like n=1 Tax=Lycorma delicatula TaxID=130591 RepID=UPI003F513E83
MTINRLFGRTSLFLLICIPLAVLSYSQYKYEYKYDNPEHFHGRNRRALPVTTKPTLTGESCYGYKGTKGRCLDLEVCVLKPLEEDYIKYKDYFCITKQRKVGVCCPNAMAIPQSYNPNKSKTAISTSDKAARQKRMADFDVPKSIIVEENTCGRNGKLLSEDLSAKTWPWMASIMVPIDNELRHHCGGTLITRFHVLTAAHCFVFKEGIAVKDFITVRLGEYDFDKADETESSDYKVADMINHEDYDLYTYENDITLLVLDRPVKYSIYIQPICMPKQNEDYKDKKTIVVGWGHTKHGGPGSNVLKQIELPIWTYGSCSNNMTQTIFTTNLCAGDTEGKRDSCQADSGGPLMIQRKVGVARRWEIAGIVSWGIRCAEKGRPGVYTQVNKYLNWIYEKINA